MRDNARYKNLFKSLEKSVLRYLERTSQRYQLICFFRKMRDDSMVKKWDNGNKMIVIMTKMTMMRMMLTLILLMIMMITAIVIGIIVITVIMVISVIINNSSSCSSK